MYVFEYGPFVCMFLVAVTLRAADICARLLVFIKRVVNTKLFPDLLLPILRLLSCRAFVIGDAKWLLAMRCDAQRMSTVRPEVEGG